MFPGSVRDNVLFGLKQQKWPGDDRDRRVAEMLELVGLTGAEDDVAGSLSEDERARLALARALAPRPSVLLFEAPTASIDEVLKADYRARLREILRSIPLTTVIFTDDLRDAVGMADDLHVMARGRIVQSGALSRVLSGPNSIEVAELVGYVTLVRGEVDGSWILEPNAGAIAFPAGYPLKGVARALAHPSTMLGVPESSGLGCGVSGMIERVRAVGPTYLLDLRVGDRLIEVRWEWDLAPPPRDQPIGIAVTPSTLRFFNEPHVRRPAASDGEEASQTPDHVQDAATGESDDASVGFDDADLGQDSASRGGAAAPVDVAPEDSEAADAAPAVEDARAMRPPHSMVSEFTPSQGLMAEPAPPREDPAPETYEPYEPWQPSVDAPETFTPDGAPAPAPAPPRAPVAPSASVPRAADDGGGDDSVEAMAPWLQVSRPRDEPPTSPTDPHRGMPLD